MLHDIEDSLVDIILRRSMIIMFRFAVLLFILSGMTAQADTFKIFTAHDGSLYISHGDGFMINFPVEESTDLLGQVQQYRSDLIHHSLLDRAL